MIQTFVAYWFAPALTVLSLVLMSVLTVRAWRIHGFYLRLIISWCVLLLSIITGTLCIFWSTESTKQGLEHRLSNLAKVMAVSIEDMGHAGITLETPGDDPVYVHIMNSMKRWMRRVPSMASVYTVRLDENGEYIFIADPMTDLNRNGIIDEGEEDLPIGTLYGDAFVDVPEFIDAFEGRPGFNRIPLPDEFGSWVTAAEPMFDRDGNIEAILGVDFWGDEWIESVNASKFWPALFYSSFLALFFAVQFFLLKHHRAEEQLKKYATELEQSVDQLVKANQKADDAVKAKDEFLANMSHEIRTPMNAILGMLHLIQRTDLTEKQFSYVENAERSTKLLLRVVNDILDFSKIEAGKLEIEHTSFSLRKTLADLYNLIGESARKKNLELGCEIPEDVPDRLVGDSVRLSQILVNLASNAVKFTQKGSVWIRVRQEREDGDSDRGSGGIVKLRFAVQDTGIGMSREQVTRLFLPFTQADASTTRKYGGTGLGLAISKRLVEIMEGTIWCESEVDQGATFFFTARFGLPDHADRQARPKETGQEPDKADRGGGIPDRIRDARILLAEDNKINQMVAVDLLTMEGFDVDVAANGLEVLDKLERRHYDLILMDIQMPEMDGFEATRTIRRNPKYADLPILAMTAHAMSGDHERSIEAGMNDHITKPIDPDTFYSTLAKWIDVGRRP